MSDRDEMLRDLAAVRRAIGDLEDEISTAEGAMPQSSQVAEAGRQNFMVVLKRLETIEETAGEAAETLRDVLSAMDG